MASSKAKSILKAAQAARDESLECLSACLRSHDWAGVSACQRAFSALLRDCQELEAVVDGTGTVRALQISYQQPDERTIEQIVERRAQTRAREILAERKEQKEQRGMYQ